MGSLTIFHHAILLIGLLLSPAVLSFSLEGLPREGNWEVRCPNACEGITFQNESYVCGDPRLGPVILPKKFPLSTELRMYARFGNICPKQFLEKWAPGPSNAWYTYPPASGFVIDTENQPILGNATLPVGAKVDRFGSEYGSFLAPLGAPYIQRALPPSNLNAAPGADYPYNYHVYQVTKEFVVGMGPIAPWFEQPGAGTQYVTYDKVIDLINGGFLRRLTEDEYDERPEYSDDYTPGPGSAQ
ncbi:hypothetical protein DTO217A2_7075 [Paecilomyces variotii]|nr:hypothetical protein DTO217A2_7075 [Paecilomyces variotii]